MEKLLITGASGFLGWNLCQLARNQWQVYGTYFTHKVEIPKVTLSKVDLRDFSALKQLFSQIKPAAVIHAAAASKPDYCQLHPQESYQINVVASVNIARLCSEYSIPCVFTSTELVFDGKYPPYRETDPVSPICYYGEQKVEVEQKMLQIYPPAAVCRMPLMFGLTPAAATTFIQPLIQNLRAGKEVNLFTDEFRTPVSGMTAAKGVLLALEQVGGLLHLGGKARISRYNFGYLLAEVLQLSPSLIKSCRQQDVAMVAPRSPDTSLDSSKAFALGYQPLPLKEELMAIAPYL